MDSQAEIDWPTAERVPVTIMTEDLTWRDQEPVSRLDEVAKRYDVITSDGCEAIGEPACREMAVSD